jgi:hypothetical protein
MKIYFKLVASIILVCGMITCAQQLISEPSNVEVVFGFGLLILIGPVSYYLSRWCISEFRKKESK